MTSMHHNLSQLPDLSVIAPCLNEEENIDALVSRTITTFDSADISAELILVDDGSTDDTWQRIIDCCRRDRRVRGVKHTSNQGMESAWRTGIGSARGHLVCLIDADLQNRPEDIARLYVKCTQEQCDIAQAVRHSVHCPRRCLIFSRGLNYLLNFTFRMHLRDNKSGFILASREALERILTHRFDYRYFQCFIGVAAKIRGYMVVEVDTYFDERHGGNSFLSKYPIGVCLRTLWELLKYRIETLIPTSRQVAPTPCNWPPSTTLAGTTGSES